MWVTSGPAARPLACIRRECGSASGTRHRITLDAYGHVVAGLHDDAAERVAALFRTASNPLAESLRGAEDLCSH